MRDDMDTETSTPEPAAEYDGRDLFMGALFLLALVVAIVLTVAERLG